MNPYVFVVGCPWSGVERLGRMLDAHPDLAVAAEAQFVFEPITGLEPLGAPPTLDPGWTLTPSDVAAVRADPGFAALGLDDALVDRAAARSGTYTGFVSELFTEFAAKRGKTRAGTTSGRYVNVIPELHVLFPQARFVHVVRDGRDVTPAAREWGRAGHGPGRFDLWELDEVATCALWWSTHVENGRRAAETLGQEWVREVRYESLIADPTGELSKLVAFLGLTDAPGMALSGEPEPDEAGGWQASFSEADRDLFEAIAGPMLVAFGYPLSSEQWTLKVAKAAATWSEAWGAALARRAAGRT